MNRVDQSKNHMSQSLPSLFRKLSLGIRSLFQPRFKILAYHGVPKQDPSLYEVSKNQFQEQIHILHEEGYEVLDLHNAVERTRNNACPDKSIVITFDDGYLTIFENAIPILKTFQFTATIFVPTGLVRETGHGLLEGKQLMTWNQLKELRASGFSIGSHTVRHRNLIDLEDKVQVYEVMESFAHVREYISQGEIYFAYPYGLLSEKVRNLVAASPYVGALCFGSVLSNWAKTDPFLLKREKILSTIDQQQFMRLINPDQDLSRMCWGNLAKLVHNAIGRSKRH